MLKVTVTQSGTNRSVDQTVGCFVEIRKPVAGLFALQRMPTIRADRSYIWGLAILVDSLHFSVNNILAGLWLNCISSVEIALFLLADISLQYRALFHCKGLVK